MIRLFLVMSLSGAQPQEAVAARVDGDFITVAQWREQLAQRLAEVVLRDAIDEKLLEQEARRLKVKVDEKEIQGDARARGGDAPAARAARQAWLLDALSKRSVVVTAAELRSVYEANTSFFVEAAQFKLRDMVLPTRDNARQLYELLRGGGHFAQLAKTFSTDETSRDRGGDLGWLPLKFLALPLREAVAAMKLNEVSQPVELADEWHLLKLEGLKPERQKSLAESRNEIQARLLQEKLPMVRNNLLPALRKKATIDLRPVVPEP